MFGRVFAARTFPRLVSRERSEGAGGSPALLRRRSSWLWPWRSRRLCKVSHFKSRVQLAATRVGRHGGGGTRGSRMSQTTAMPAQLKLLISSS